MSLTVQAKRSCARAIIATGYCLAHANDTTLADIKAIEKLVMHPLTWEYDEITDVHRLVCPRIMERAA